MDDIHQRVHEAQIHLANLNSGAVPIKYARVAPKLHTDVEQVTVVRSDDGSLIAMTFINANAKFVSTIGAAHSDIDSFDSKNTTIQTVCVNRTGEDCIVTTRNGAQLLSQPVHSSSMRCFIIRQIYSFPNKDCLSVFVDKTSSVHGSIRTAAADLLLQQARNMLESASNYGPYQAVIDHKLQYTILESQKAVYDPNTDLVVSLKQHHDAKLPHPECDQATIRQAFERYSEEQTQTHSLHLLKVCTSHDQIKGLYYKVLGQVHRIETNACQPPMPSYRNSVVGSDMLHDYVELYSNRPSAILKNEGEYISHQYTDAKEATLIYRISLEEARQEIGLFDSPLLADTQGDPDKVAASHHQSQTLQLQADLITLKKEAEERKNYWSQAEHERVVNELMYKAKLDREEEARKANADRLRLEEELRKAQLSRAEQELKMKHSAAEAEQKERHAESNQRRSNDDADRKGWIETLKVVGAVVGLGAVIVAAAVKFSAVAAAGLIGGAIASAVSGIGSLVGSACSAASRFCSRLFAW